MKQLFLLAFVLIQVSYGYVISHGDTQNTRTDISSDKNGDLTVIIKQELDCGTYFIKNEETGVAVDFFMPEIENKRDGVVTNIFELKDHGKNYKFDYSTSNQQAQQEEGIHVKDADGSESLEVKGRYTYIHPQNRVYIQGYTADKNGFRTKVSFGSKILISISGVKSEAQSPPADTKGIDGALLCSLVGGGCKK